MSSIPRSLQAMIANARHAVKNWDDSDDDSDEYGCIDVAKDWTVKLSQGVYDEDLYWECVAEDCEADGNWEGAKAAYQRLQELEEQDADHRLFGSHDHLSSLHSAIGEFELAAKHARLATQRQRDRSESIFLRTSLVSEAWLLVRLQRIDQARELVVEGFATFEPDSGDNLGYCKLLIAKAACELAKGDQTAVQKTLREARERLDAQWGELYAADFAEVGGGILYAYSAWCQIEAKRRRIAGEGAAEIEAWSESLRCARQAAEGWNQLGRDAQTMRAAMAHAEACARHGRMEDAARSHAEAEAIRTRWHLPFEDAKPR